MYLNDGFQRGADYAGRTITRSHLTAFHDLSSIVIDDEATRVAFTQHLVRERKVAAMIYAAGRIAEGIARSLPVDLADDVAWFLYDEDDDLGTDEAALVQLANLAASDGVTDPEAWLEDICEETESVLRERWQEVERLAAALVEKRHLDRGSIIDLLRTG